MEIATDEATSDRFLLSWNTSIAFANKNMGPAQNADKKAGILYNYQSDIRQIVTIKSQNQILYIYSCHFILYINYRFVS